MASNDMGSNSQDHTPGAIQSQELMKVDDQSTADQPQGNQPTTELLKPPHEVDAEDWEKHVRAAYDTKRAGRSRQNMERMVSKCSSVYQFILSNAIRTTPNCY